MIVQTFIFSDNPKATLTCYHCKKEIRNDEHHKFYYGSASVCLDCDSKTGLGLTWESVGYKVLDKVGFKN